MRSSLPRVPNEPTLCLGRNFPPGCHPLGWIPGSHTKSDVTNEMTRETWQWFNVKLLASGLYPAKVLAGIACPFGEFHFRDQLGLLPPLLKLCKEVAVGSSRNFLLGDAVPFFGDPSCPSNGSFGVGPISTHSVGPALSLCSLCTALGSARARVLMGAKWSQENGFIVTLATGPPYHQNAQSLHLCQWGVGS